MGAARREPFGRGRTAARVLARVIDAAAWAGSRIPARVAHGLAVVGGHVEWAVRPGKRRVLAVNLAHAVGGEPRSRRVRSLVRRELVNEARRSADLLWAIGRRDEFLVRVRVEGAGHAAAAAQRGRGVVLAGVHVGGWEVAAPVPAVVVPVPTTVIVADNWLAWAIEHVRTAAGLRTVFASKLALEPLRVLRRGEALLVLGDDATHASTRSYRVRFCDGEAELPAGMVTLARLTGAAIVPFSVLPNGPRDWTVTIDPPIDPPARDGGPQGERVVLQAVADRWSATIEAHPEHWAASFPVRWCE